MNRSEIMRRVPSRNTSLERMLRRELWRQGLRYATRAKIYGNPDIVFVRAKVAVFVDSCFWHGCRMHCRVPVSNVAYWEAKFRRNRQRDRMVTAALESDGWCVVRVWEHDLKTSLETTAAGIVCIVKDRLAEGRHRTRAWRARDRCRQSHDGRQGGGCSGL